MNSQEPGNENDANRKERRKLQNTIAQRKYRHKQREKTRELEQRLSTVLAPPIYSNSVVPSSQSYTQGISPRASQISLNATPSPAVTLPFDFLASNAFSDNDFTTNDPYTASQTFSSSHSESNHPGSAMEPLLTDDFSTSYFPSPDFDSNLGGETDRDSTKLKASEVLSYLCKDSERKSIVKMIDSEGLGLRDFVKHGLVALGSKMEVTQYNSANEKSAGLWIKEIGSACTPYDIQLIVWTGIRVILQMKAQSDSTNQRDSSIRQKQSGQLPDIYASTIKLKCVPWLSASVANAEFLQIPLELLLNDDSESPFTQQTKTTSTLHTSATKVAPSTSSQAQAAVPYRVKQITSDMTPTAVQYSHSHHPYLDLIPWPSFRSKAIIATCLNPPLIDEEDLCLDLMNNAMRCWGSMRSLHGRGEGTPWDMRSWEAAPWFIEKWAMLMDGDRGEIARNSAWWRSQRGMPSLD